MKRIFPVVTLCVGLSLCVSATTNASVGDAGPASVYDAGADTSSPGDTLGDIESDPGQWLSDLYHAVRDGQWWLAVGFVLGGVAFALRRWRGLIETRWKWIGTDTGSIVVLIVTIVAGGLANALVAGEVDAETFLTAGKAIVVGLITAFAPELLGKKKKE